MCCTVTVRPAGAGTPSPARARRSRRRSRAMVRSTREPSRKVRRWLSPWIRGLSNEAISTTRRPAARARTLRKVSTSKPSSTAVEGGQHVPPEGHVAVAEVGVAAAEGHPHRLGQHEVAERAERGQVAAAAALQEAGPLGHVGAGVSAATKVAMSSGSIEPSASIITRMSPLAAAKPACRAMPLPRPRLDARSWRRAQLADHVDRAVGRPAVDDDQLVDHVGKGRQHVPRFSASFSVGMMRLTRSACVDGSPPPA